jgi:hypothetical protein
MVEEEDTMEPKKLVIDEKLKLRLEEMDKILTELCPDDEEEVRGGDGCGGVCRFTCSTYCRPTCEVACKDSCAETCVGVCSRYANMPGMDTCGLMMIIWWM